MKNTININTRQFFFAIAAICFALLACAYYLQYGPVKAQPCPLCILQRYAYIAIALISVLAATHNPKKNALLIYLMLADLAALAGLGCAVWQVSKGASMNTCLVDPVGVFVNGLPMANWWPTLFFANGSCADQYPPILGLSIPQWSLLWFGFFMLAFGFFAAMVLRKK